MVLNKLKNPSIAEGSGETSQSGVSIRQGAVDGILEGLESIRDQAKEHNFKLLAYLIDMAILEAKDMSKAKIDKF